MSNLPPRPDYTSGNWTLEGHCAYNDALIARAAEMFRRAHRNMIWAAVLITIAALINVAVLFIQLDGHAANTPAHSQGAA